MLTHAHAHVVIIGSGIVGSAVAYHLAKLGWKDILLLDMGDLHENPGSTSHAPGGVVALSHSKLLTQMAQYGSDLYRGLALFSDKRNVFNPVGGLEMALSEQRWQDLIRLNGEAKSFHAEAYLLTPHEAKAMHPLLNDQSFVGALFVPKSGIASGVQISAALQRDAMQLSSVTCIGHTRVTDIETTNGHVTAVLTNNPDLPRITCETAVLATNIWGPVLGDKVGVPLPLMAYEHQYVITEPIAALAKFDPNMRNDEIIYPTARVLDKTFYFRQHWNAIGVGNYWHAPRPVNPHQVGETALRAFTPKDFVLCWDAFTNTVPLAKNARLAKSFNGMFAFPVDGMPMMGESAVKGLWTAVGSWLTHAGGVGKMLAEWMTFGESEWDARQVNLHRFHRFQTTKQYVSVIGDKNYNEVWEIVHPRQPLSKPRDVRLSPFHARWQSLSTSFTSFAGIELPNWCEQNAGLLEKYDDQIPERTGWASAYWSRVQGAEHLATRESVALYDLTSLSIFEVSGKGALDYVNYLCSNQMDVKPGRVVYTCWLTPKGGVRRDLAVARLSADRFWMFVGDGTRPQDWQWVNQFKPNDSTVDLTDVSDMTTALGLWGPNARKVLEKVTGDDVSNAGFPYFTSRWIEIGTTPVYALRVSYAGELGWELHIPVDAALPVWDALWEAGRAFGIIGAGMGAFDSLRLEKGYRGWGSDVYTEHTPYEAGLGWTVKLDKPDFVGKAAVERAKLNGQRKKLCCITLDDRNAVLIGAEPISLPHPNPLPKGEEVGTGYHNGAGVLGYVTSANFGYSVGKFLAYGYLPMEHAAVGTKVEIEYFGQRYGGTVAEDPIFDAKMTRLKG
jgi:glycine cleavage system aminomethyltransferase T/glycine/D-amino acid oxidase-like deaminating enzyme